MKSIIFLIILMIYNSISLFSQTEDVNNCLKLITEGKIDDAKMKLPDLLAQYPDDPGVIFLHAVVIEDGFKAVKKYTEVVKEYPESEWADDAMLRIIQFYAIIGDTTRAKSFLTDFREKYTDSNLLAPAIDAVKVSLFTHRKNIQVKSFEEIDLSDKPTKATVNEPKKPMEETLKPKVDSTISHKFGLQVGIYSTYDAAKRESEKYKNLRMINEIKPKKIGDETMYAVVIGDYKKKAEAEDAKGIIRRQCNCIPIIFEK